MHLHLASDVALHILPPGPRLPHAFYEVDLAGALREFMAGVNGEMQAVAAVDGPMSGTTAMAALVVGGALHVANIGDSCAVAGVCRYGYVAAEDLFLGPYIVQFR